MRDRAPKGALLACSVDVYVDPLARISGLCEVLDIALRDLVPRGRPEWPSAEREESLKAVEHHASHRPSGRIEER